uniref:Uncharacterized protein n=1 Tax=viral metagenome TaxID=1070528 RepID=A0A6C0IB56_9ZZZZ
MSAVVGTTAAGIVGLSVFSNYITAPTQIPGLQLWLDASSSNNFTLSNTSNVVQWNDKSSNGFHFQTVGGIPKYAGGTRGVFFISDSNDYMRSISSNITYIGGVTNVFIVGMFSNANNNLMLVFGSNTDNSLRYTRGSAPNANDIYYSTGQQIFNINGTSVPLMPQSSIFFYNIFSFVVGAQAFFTSPSYIQLSADRIIRGGSTLTGFINEVIFYSNTLTANQRTQVEGYLAWKWGLNSNLPVSHFQLNSNITGLSATVPTGNTTAYNAPFSNFITAPTQVPGLQLWLDASSSNNFTLSNTSNVVQWNDKSANSNNFQRVQGTPTLISPIQGVFFSSTRTDLMRSFSSNISYTANITNLFVVAMYSNPGNYAYIINFGCNTDVSLRYNGGAGANPNDFYFNYTLSQQIFNVNGTFTNGFTPSGNTINIYNIFSGVYGPSAGGTSSPSFIQLSSAFNGRYLNGFINEVLMYSNALTANQRTQVEGYLAWKWGLNSNLPVSHYQKNSNTTGIAAPIPTTAPGFVPSSFLPSVYSNLALWLDAADATTIQYSSGANISNWRDKSGNGRNAIQAISIQQPIYTNKGVNFIRANNTNLVTTYTAQPIIEYLFIVINYTNPGGNAENIIRGNGVQSRQIFLNSSTNCILGVESLTSYTSATLSQNQIILLETIYNSNTSNAQINVNGSIIATANTGIVGSNPFNTGAGNTTIGYNTNSMDSTVYEVIVYSNVLTSQQRQNVEGYLAWKWGLTPSLPSTHQNAYIPP